MRKIIWTGLFLVTLTTGASELELYGLTKRSEIISERGAVDRWVWRTENSVLSLIPPATWDIAVKPQEKKLLLRYIPYLSGISIRVATNTSGAVANGAAPQTLRDQVFKRFPEAIIREEFVGHSMLGLGPVIDVEVRRNDSRICHRIAWLAFKGGFIEVELTSPERYFEQCHRAWTAVLNSLGAESLPKNG